MSVDQISDIETLRTLVKLQQKESERLRSEIVELNRQLHGDDPEKSKQLALRIAQLEKQQQAAVAKLFGTKRSERGKNARKKKKNKTKQKGHGPTKQPELPVRLVEHTLTEDDATCDACSKPLSEWEGQFEESEEVEYEPGKLVLLHHRRKKYRCTCGGCVKTADGPTRLFPKARYSIAFAINVALKKYCYHMPLERQSREFKRMGLAVGTNTLWDYLHHIYKLLEPALGRLSDYLNQQPVIGVDETTWRILKSDKRGHSKKYWVWARCAPDAVHYAIDPSRGSEAALKILSDYEGTVIADGYSVYESLANRPETKFELAHCWCHARRDLLAHVEYPAAARAVRVIEWLYRLERRADGKSDAERLEIRQRRTKPLLLAFFKWLESLKIPPTNDLKKAFQYIVLRKKSLLRFLDDPAIHPDNNGTERALRSVVLGRKNHYGSKSERGTKVAALFYSLLESAQLAGVNPHDYLRQAVDAALKDEIVPLPHELDV